MPGDKMAGNITTLVFPTCVGVNRINVMLAPSAASSYTAGAIIISGLLEKPNIKILQLKGILSPPWTG